MGVKAMCVLSVARSSLEMRLAVLVFARNNSCVKTRHS